jgi:predicted dehydrogenase
MADPAQAGCGAYGDLGTHALDILLWLLGAVDTVAAAIQPVTRRYGDCDESGEGMLKFASGAVATLAAGWVDLADPVRLMVSGTEGFACVMQNNLFFQSKHVPGADGKTPWTALPEAWPHAFDLFLDAVNGKPDVPLVPVREAAYCCAVMAALYEASLRQSWVAPTGPRP